MLFISLKFFIFKLTSPTRHKILFAIETVMGRFFEDELSFKKLKWNWKKSESRHSADTIRWDERWREKSRKTLFYSALDVLALINHFVRSEWCWKWLRTNERMRVKFKGKNEKSPRVRRWKKRKHFQMTAQRKFCRLRLWTFFFSLNSRLVPARVSVVLILSFETLD